ncbi:hypothetical protein APHAL10511_001850 [Amanita phalloides]|nr:hypothetical protein APHAL10511_001850 [Amanita phalloides]
MNLLILVLQAIVFLSFSCAAHRVPLKQIKISPHLQRRDITPQITTNSSNVLDLTSVDDLLYIVNMNVGGIDYPVQIDTGSSDLWIKNNSSAPLPNVSRTSTALNLTYAVGWAAGYIAYAPIVFAGLSVPQQAFVEATSVDNPAVESGARGVAGLGFTSLSSIDAKGNQTQSNADRSLLYNLFQVNPSQPNFIGFILQPNFSNSSHTSQEGSFSIGEYEPGYERIANQPSIPTWPVESPSRWTVLLDSIIVGDQIIVPSTSVSDAPSNKAVVLVDSGSTFTYASPEVVNAIYGNVTGAEFNSQLGKWVVPCSHEIDMALQIGGQVFPLHPLDVTPSIPGDDTKCFGSFIPGSFSTAAGEFDYLIGDNFLRSVYAIYDFGDFKSSGGAMGNPYMKMLSLVDPDRASVEFHNARGGTPNLNITFVGLQGTSVDPVYSLSQDVTDSIRIISKLVPIMVAVIAFNTLILIALVVAGIVYIYKRRRSGRNPHARPIRGRTSPIPMNPVNSYIAGLDHAQQLHRYEPVSMALTEDTVFAPPSPAFHKYDDTASGSGDRPKSFA